MKPLQEPCKSAINEGFCLGCNRLEAPEFVGDKNCKEYIRNGVKT